MEESDNENRDINEGAGSVALIALAGLSLICTPMVVMECETHLVGNRPIFQRYEDMSTQERALEDSFRKKFTSAYNIDDNGAMNRFSLLYKIQSGQKRL